jgi:hypothetical protein
VARHAKPEPGDGRPPDTLPAGTLATVLAAVATGDQTTADSLAWAESNARLN